MTRGEAAMASDRQQRQAKLEEIAREDDLSAAVGSAGGDGLAAPSRRRSSGADPAAAANGGGVVASTDTAETEAPPHEAPGAATEVHVESDEGDRVEAETQAEPDPHHLQIAGTTFDSRLIVGTGKYPSNQVMVEAIEASGARMVTVAVRRVD